MRAGAPGPEARELHGGPGDAYAQGAALSAIAASALVAGAQCRRTVQLSRVPGATGRASAPPPAGQRRGWAVSRGAVRAQVIDFGLAHSVDDAASPCLGTPEYIAPEMLVGAEAKAGGTAAPPQAVDVWGAGIVLYMLVAGRYPFQACRPAQAPLERVTCASVLPVRSL